MNKYLRLLIFYVLAAIIIYVLELLSPGAHDGGLGLGGLAVLLLVLTIVVLLIISLYKGFAKDKTYFIIAAIHFVILMVGAFTLFL